MSIENQKLAVDAVVFDLDGTLIDSVPIYYEIIDIVFAEIGVPAVSRETLQDAMDDGEFDCRWRLDRDFVLTVAARNPVEMRSVQ